MNKFLYFLLFLFLTSSVLEAQKFKNLLPTPPMGWNSWNRFGCDIDEDLVKETADAMASSGMAELGYEFVVIDDCWQIDRDKDGYIIADPERFPSGIKALVDYVHSKGLKFGIYSCAGRKTCQRRPGSRNFERQDAEKYAEWGVDYLKLDWCYHWFQNAEESYTRMAEELVKADHPIILSICEWGKNEPWLGWGEKVGHLWRTTRDIKDCWDCKDLLFDNKGWTRILDDQVGLEAYAGPDAWNDPDMLQVGNGGLTQDECKAHFAFWSLLAAPLFAGNDLRDMSDEIKEILMNEEAIAVNQDRAAKQGYKIRDEGDFEIWEKPLYDGDRALIFFNRSEEPMEVTVDWNELGVMGRYTVRDLWKHEDIGSSQENIKTTLAPHSVLFVRLISLSKAP